jgi:hypothetical protein
VVTNSAIAMSADQIWREDANYDKGPINNEDLTLPAGQYELQAVCSTSTEVRIAVNNGKPRSMTCSETLAPGLKICTTKPGLFVSLTRGTGPTSDLVWGLKKIAPQKCDPDQ